MCTSKNWAVNSTPMHNRQKTALQLLNKSPFWCGDANIRLRLSVEVMHLLRISNLCTALTKKWLNFIILGRPYRREQCTVKSRTGPSSWSAQTAAHTAPWRWWPSRPATSSYCRPWTWSATSAAFWTWLPGVQASSAAGFSLHSQMSASAVLHSTVRSPADLLW